MCTLHTHTHGLCYAFVYFSVKSCSLIQPFFIVCFLSSLLFVCFSYLKSIILSFLNIAFFVCRINAMLNARKFCIMYTCYLSASKLLIPFCCRYFCVQIQLQTAFSISFSCCCCCCWLFLFSLYRNSPHNWINKW